MYTIFILLLCLVPSCSAQDNSENLQAITNLYASWVNNIKSRQSDYHPEISDTYDLRRYRMHILPTKTFFVQILITRKNSSACLSCFEWRSLPNQTIQSHSTILNQYEGDIKTSSDIINQLLIKPQTLDPLLSPLFDTIKETFTFEGPT